jgi:hypothetical protein
MRREGNVLEGDDPGEGGSLANLDHPPSVAATLEVGAQPQRHRFGELARRDSVKKLRDPRIGVHLDPRLDV